MHKEEKEELRLRFKLLVLALATHFGSTETCRDLLLNLISMLLIFGIINIYL